MTVFSWIITALVLTLLVCFVAMVASMRALPTAERPRTRTYDRFGEFITERENPDYHENPGENSRQGPDIIPTSGGREK